MCLIAFAVDAHPHCPLLIASNRDEYLDRPTAPLHRWQTPAGAAVVAGRDLRDGGTWLGLSPGGRVAMLTNVRDAQAAPAARSRGELATRWLEGTLDWAGLQASIDPGQYGGFNLVVGDFHPRFWAWLGNRHPRHPHQTNGPVIRLHTRVLEPGVYGLSNATLNTPWPKSRRLMQAVRQSLGRAAPPDASGLAVLTRALGDDRCAPDHAVPQTGLPPDWERALSSPFVRMPQRRYGTRSSLVVRVFRSPTVQTGAPEKDADQGADEQGERRWRVCLDEWTHAHERVETSTDWPTDGTGGGHRREQLDW
jgi:uncharacterized protein with NRDE domain